MKNLKSFTAALALAAAVCAGGCARNREELSLSSANDRRVVATILDEQAVQGVVRQRTVYPWQFHPGTAVLNELGRRDLLALADALREQPGPVNVSGARDGDRLREARVSAVKSFLSEQGVSGAVISSPGTWPEGDGMTAGSAALRYRNTEVRSRSDAPPPGAIPIGPMGPMGGMGAVPSTPYTAPKSSSNLP